MIINGITYQHIITTGVYQCSNCTSMSWSLPCVHSWRVRISLSWLRSLYPLWLSFSSDTFLARNVLLFRQVCRVMSGVTSPRPWVMSGPRPATPLPPIRHHYRQGRVSWPRTPVRWMERAPNSGWHGTHGRCSISQSQRQPPVNKWAVQSGKKQTKVCRIQSGPLHRLNRLYHREIEIQPYRYKYDKYNYNLRKSLHKDVLNSTSVRHRLQLISLVILQ